MVLRNRHAVTRGRRWRSAKDDGFSLIEVIVALGLLTIVMLSTAGFFVTSLKTSSTQVQSQEAALLANQQLEYTRSVPVKALLNGRTQAQVVAATTAPAPGITDLSQDVISGYNYDGWDGAPSGQTSQVVPISQTWTVSGAVYTVTTFVDRCYVVFGAAQQCVRTAGSGASWLYRITVNVAWKLGGGQACPNASRACQFVVSTLRDPGTDPCFNVNVAFAGCSVSQPIILSIAPNTVTTNSTTTVTLTGVNFDPGAQVTIDAGGTVSNVVVLSATSITFTLVSDNTAAAVGTRTIKVTDPNGRFALGTLTVTTSAINVTGVSPATVFTGSTTTLTIAGSGFQTGSVVSIPATDGTIVGTPTVTANSITLSFAAASTAAALGSSTVTVTNPDGASGTGTFTIAIAPVTITAISPATLAWGATRSFTITGTGFTSGAAVTLDGAAVNGTWVSSTSMTVALASDPAVGTHTYVVTNPDGGTASKTFTVTVNPMSVTAVTPNPTLTNSTKTFVITGTGFLSGVAVKLDGATLASGVTLNSPTQITVVLASYPAIGVHTFTVTNPDGGVGTQTFTVAKSHISSISPNSAASVVHGSKTVTITGTNFSTSGVVTAQPKVSVNGTLYNLTVVSATSATFTFTVLTGTFTYPVQITTFKDGTVSDVFSWTVKGT